MDEGGKPGGFPIVKGDPAGDGEGQKGEGDPSTCTGNAIPLCVKKWGARGQGVARKVDHFWGGVGP